MHHAYKLVAFIGVNHLLFLLMRPYVLLKRKKLGHTGGHFSFYAQLDF